MILIPAALKRRIRKSAQAAYPEECCGLLIGFHESEDRVRTTDVVVSANVAPLPRRDRFEVDPALRIQTMRRLRGTDHEIIGHYHSHPDGPAQPSAHDAAMAYEPDLLWLIIAVHKGKPGDLAAFRYDPEKAGFVAVPISPDEDREP